MGANSSCDGTHKTVDTYMGVLSQKEGERLCPQASPPSATTSIIIHLYRHAESQIHPPGTQRCTVRRAGVCRDLPSTHRAPNPAVRHQLSHRWISDTISCRDLRARSESAGCWVRRYHATACSRSPTDKREEANYSPVTSHRYHTEAFWSSPS